MASILFVTRNPPTMFIVAIKTEILASISTTKLGDPTCKSAPTTIQIKIDLNKTPFINITWKIEKDLPGIKENTKKGHDFAARVFAVKKTGATPLSNRAINYVFSSNNGIGFSSPSPYTKKSIDNVLASTKKNLDEWVTVKANVKEDFKRFHDLDVNELDGLAIMSDTDNSKMKAIAYFQNIYFSKN